MYIKINNIKGEKRIDLSYSIQNFDSGKEITVIRMLSDNVKYVILKLRTVMDPISDSKKLIPKGTYASRELLSMLWCYCHYSASALVPGSIWLHMHHVGGTTLVDQHG